jgi:diguanylate cyclase (GGDEF)-like protein
MSNKVLIIDDSIPLHKLITAYLEPDGQICSSAYDGEAGLIAAANLRPDLILLDVDMPRMDGFEVCRRLKANPETAAIPVIFVSGSAVLDNRVKALDLGASDFVSKPFKPSELRARVRAALRSRHQLETKSLVDEPTGLWNRTYLDAHVGYHVSRARRFHISLSCIVAEIDHVDDLSGQLNEEVEAEVVRAVGHILIGQCRAEDVVCRYDTWKFAILVTGARDVASLLIANRLRNEVERQMNAAGSRMKGINCSFGVADMMDADASMLVERANAALDGMRRARLSGVSLGGEDGGFKIAV